MGQLSGHKVKADSVTRTQLQNNIEDPKGAGGGLVLYKRLLLQAFRLVAFRVHPGDAQVGFGEHGFKLFILVAGQDGAKEIPAFYWGCEDTWKENAHSLLEKGDLRPKTSVRERRPNTFVNDRRPKTENICQRLET